MVKYAKHQKAKILAITNYPISPIAKLADVVLLTATFVPTPYGEVMTKRIPELCLLESLYVNVVMQSDCDINATLIRSNKAVSMNKI